MNAHARQSVSRRAIRWPAAVACLLLIAAWAAPAGAGVLYRCTGPHGELALVSHTAGYTHCKKVDAPASQRARAMQVADRRVAQNAKPPAVLPGKPPRDVKANPEILKVMPLGEQSSLQIHKLVLPKVWQPLPVSVLDTLGGSVLPQLLGMAPKATPAAAASSASVPPPPQTAAIPLHLDADAGKPKPPRTGAVYRVVRKDGTVMYTNVESLAKKGDARKLFTYIVGCYACDVHSKIDWNKVPLRLADYRDDVLAAVKLSGVNAALLRAIIHAESGFNPRALSEKGAQGLMQLMPETAFDFGVGDAFDPGENISGGARYLATLLRDYHGDVRLAAAAYNAGPGAVAKYGGVPPYAQTQVYVKRVAVLYRRYRKALVRSTSLAAAGG